MAHAAGDRWIDNGITVLLESHRTP
jgi:hypothetical protein